MPTYLYVQNPEGAQYLQYISLNCLSHKVLVAVHEHNSIAQNYCACVCVCVCLCFFATQFWRAHISGHRRQRWSWATTDLHSIMHLILIASFLFRFSTATIYSMHAHKHIISSYFNSHENVLLQWGRWCVPTSGSDAITSSSYPMSSPHSKVKAACWNLRLFLHLL